MTEETRSQDGGLFALGILHGKVETLTARVDRQEAVLGGIDKKLDDVLIALASAVGGRASIRALIKWFVTAITAVGACSGLVAGIMHYVSFGVKP